jgi:hypothetical protein
MSVSAGTNGEVRFGRKNGQTSGPFQGILTLNTPKEGYYLDVTRGTSDYPTKLDFTKDFDTKVVSITFKPGVGGKTTTYSTWAYFSNPAHWTGDRFTKLG